LEVWEVNTENTTLARIRRKLADTASAQVRKLALKARAARRQLLEGRAGWSRSGVGLAKKALRDHKEIPEFRVRRN
jgi:hypothetical protein